MQNLDNIDGLDRKIVNIDKLIDRYSQQRLICDDDNKQKYENFIINLNNQKLAIKKFSESIKKFIQTF